MRLNQQIALNREIIENEKCPKCHARRGERCRSNGVAWDQGIHRLRIPEYRTTLYTVRFHHHKPVVKNIKF